MPNIEFLNTYREDVARRVPRGYPVLEILISSQHREPPGGAMVIGGGAIVYALGGAALRENGNTVVECVSNTLVPSLDCSVVFLGIFFFFFTCTRIFVLFDFFRYV